MGTAYFYQLSARPLEVALPQLLEKALEKGWRIQVRSAEKQQLAYLDDMLWAKPEDGFLPHKIANVENAIGDDELHPILISQKALKGRECLMAVLGAEITAQEVKDLTRTCVIFDGAHSEELSKARVLWKTLKNENCHAQYWAEQNGSWIKKAETPKET